MNHEEYRAEDGEGEHDLGTDGGKGNPGGKADRGRGDSVTGGANAADPRGDCAPVV